VLRVSCCPCCYVPAPCAGLCLVSSDTLVPAAPEDTTPITGFPEGSWINYTSWSPDGKHITFTTRSPGAADTHSNRLSRTEAGSWVMQRGIGLQDVVPWREYWRFWIPSARSEQAQHALWRALWWAIAYSVSDSSVVNSACVCAAAVVGGPGDPPRGPLQLWIAETATGKARPLLGSRRLNTVFDSYTWCALRRCSSLVQMQRWPGSAYSLLEKLWRVLLMQCVAGQASCLLGCEPAPVTCHICT
jgi:hypothetical protein